MTDAPPSERLSREVLLRAANSYFDALEGDNGKIAAFADDCVRHENSYQTVNNPPPGGRNMPGPNIPTADTEAGRAALVFSMLTCAQQIDSRIFAYMKYIRPRRALVIDQQRGLVSMYPLFIHDGTRRGAKPGESPGMLQNLVTVEKIHEVEVFPFVTIRYGLGNGWTPGSAR